MEVSFFWISNPCARLDGWKTLQLHQLQQIMLVLFEIYIQKLIIRIESWFWSFNAGMNGITDAHIFVWRMRTFLYGGLLRPPYNVHVGYSIHTFIKRPINFQFLIEYVLFYQFYAKITTFFRSRDVRFGSSLIRWRRNFWRELTWKWRQDDKNDAKTSKSSYWHRARESSYTPHVRRHFLAPVGFTEIPVGYARMTVYWIWRSTEFQCFTLKFQYSRGPSYVIFSINSQATVKHSIVCEPRITLKLYSTL